MKPAPKAVPDYPFRLIQTTEIEEEYKALYDGGLSRGDLPGWPAVDQLLSLAPGMVTIITGWPGAGKSEWLDAVACNLVSKGWKFAVYSPENQPIELHLSKWSEKFNAKPFAKGPTPRMTWDDAREIMVMLREHFVFISPKDDNALTPIQIMEAASILFDDDFLNRKKHALIVDPWNELYHDWPTHTTETKYIGDTLGLIRRWARARKVHVFIVAHPAKQARESGKLPVPKPDMISGGAHWWNKADQAICVHRDFADYNRQDVDIHVQKVRFKHIGHAGIATLRYDKITGLYSPFFGVVQ